MLRPPGLLLLTALALPVSGIPAGTPLTLVDEPPFNVFDLTLSGASITTSTAQSTVGGTVMAGFDVDPDTGRTAELTLSEGQVTSSDFGFSGSVLAFGFPVGSYTLAASGLAGRLFTLDSPGVVTPASGEFDASQHRLVLDAGTVSGTAVGQSIEQSFTPEDPLVSEPSGTGVVILTPMPPNGDFLVFEVSVILPGLTATDTIEPEGGIGGPVTITASGDLKASGTLEVAASEYLAWALAEGIAGQPGTADANHDGVPNAIAWALGLGAFDDARSHLPRPDGAAPTGFVLSLPVTGTAAPLVLEAAAAPGSWSELPAARCSLGLNPLPAGSTGTVTIAPSGLPAEFLRLQMDE